MVMETLCRMLAEQMDVDRSEITPETNIIEDLGADSLDIVELISALEDEFDLVITDERVRELYTVKDVAEFIENLL